MSVIVKLGFVQLEETTPEYHLKAAQIVKLSLDENKVEDF